MKIKRIAPVLQVTGLVALGAPTNLPMPPVFNQGNVPRLGYVDVNLINPRF